MMVSSNFMLVTANINISLSAQCSYSIFISHCADATVYLTNGLFSGNEGGTVDVCVEGVLNSPLGVFEADLIVRLSAIPADAGQ